MSFDAEGRTLERVAAAPILHKPFAHCVVENIFPQAFYEKIIDCWPEEESWQPLADSGRVAKGSYEQRMVVLMDEAGYSRLDEVRRAFWQRELGGWLMGPLLRQLLLKKFATELAQSGFAAPLDQTSSDALIVSDRTRYSIGPHTDAPHRVVSLLFYLPEDSAFRRFGTSLYVPLDPQFRCRGGPHHAFALFARAKTIEFVPNRLVLFPKSDCCFHGVEPVDLPGVERRLLIHNVRRAS